MVYLCQCAMTVASCLAQSRKQSAHCLERIARHAVQTAQDSSPESTRRLNCTQKHTFIAVRVQNIDLASSPTWDECPHWSRKRRLQARNAAILPDVHHRSQNSTRASFLPIFLATERSRHCVPAILPLVADKNEKVAANVPPARCFVQLRRGIPRGVAALRLHTHWTGGGAGLARDFQQRRQFHENAYCHSKILFYVY